jgi:ABC-type uncharacterized transport system involved in gliding motility auxiliary subunit
MRARLEAYAPYLAWLGLFLILAGVLLPVYMRQASTQLPTWLPWALVVAGAVLVLIWPLARPADVRTALGARRTRFGGNALILSISVIGLLVVVNFLGTRRYTIVDLTSNKQFSISHQTIQILDDLATVGQPITLTAVLPSNDQQTAADLTKLVDRYRARTDQIKFQEIDPQVDSLKLMALAERIGMKDAPPSRALVAETGSRHEIVYTGFDEQAVTEAIVKVTRQGKRKVAFTTGHDEYDPEGSGDRSYSQVKSQLEREGYEVSKINLAAITQTLAAGTYDTVIVAGPRKPFLPQEARALAAYQAGGGSLMVMVDPNVDANLGSVLAPWAITPNNDIVVQPSMLGLSPMVVVSGNDYQFHTITKDLTSLNTVFANTRSLNSGTPVTETLQVTKLAQVGDRGEWGETDFAALQQNQVQQDPADTVPPLVLAVAGEDTTSQATPEPGASAAGPKGYGRLVVFGTAALASDAFLQQFPLGTVANFDLFLNAVNWLAQEESLVSIRPTAPNDRPIKRPTSPLLLLLSSAVLAPLAVLGVGTWMYWRRR